MLGSNLQEDWSVSTGKIGTGTFLRRTRISSVTMRLLEAQGVIRPERADSGWRMFSEEDVQAAIAWRAAKKERRA